MVQLFPNIKRLASFRFSYIKDDSLTGNVKEQDQTKVSQSKNKSFRGIFKEEFIFHKKEKNLFKTDEVSSSSTVFVCSIDLFGQQLHFGNYLGY